MTSKGSFGARAALVATVACVLAVAVVLVALAEADRAKATVPGGDPSTSKHKGNKGGLDPALEQKLEAAFEKSFQRSGAPGAIVGVRTPEGTWVGTLGVADKASGEPMQADMHHRIGSVTKTFTATLLLQAAARGQLSLDDTIDQYVEGIPNGDEITLRQMADMSSGIASYTLNDKWVEEWLSDPERVWTPEELAQVGIDDSPAFEPPGTGWQYSNTNYVLLGMVLEQVTGQSVQRLYSKQIIKPLHLKATSFPDAADSSIPDPYDHGYTLQGQSDGEPVDATHWNPSSGWTAGGMISTVDDMLVYGRALGTGKGLLPREQQAERLTSFLYGLPPHSPEKAYGLGLVTVGGWLGHTGTQAGFNTTVYYHPELHTTVVVEVNSDTSVGGKTPADLIFGSLAAELGKPTGTK